MFIKKMFEKSRFEEHLLILVLLMALLSITAALASVFTVDSGTEWGEGNFSKTKELSGSLRLNNTTTTSNKYFDSGSYLSKNFDEGSSGSWPNLTVDARFDLWTFEGHTGNVPGVDAGPEGDYVYSGGGDLTLRKFWTRNGTQIWVFDPQDNSRGVSVSPNGSYVYSASAGSGVHKVWAVNGTYIWNFTGHTGSVRKVSAGPNGNFAYSGSDNDDSVRKIWVNNGTEAWNLMHGDAVLDVAAGSNGSFVYFSSGGTDNTVRKVWASNNSELWSFTGHSDSVEAISISPNGKFVYSGGSGTDDAVRKIWTSNGSEIWNFTGHTANLAAVSAGLNGKYVYSGGDDDVVRKLWAVNGSWIWNFTDHTGNVLSLSNDPNGKFVYSGSADDTVRKIRAGTGPILDGSDGLINNANATVEISDDNFSSVLDSEEVTVLNGTNIYNLSLSNARYARVNLSLSTSSSVRTPVIRNFTLRSTADKEPPNIVIHSPLNDTIRDSTPWLNITADESIDTWKYNVDSNPNTTFTPNITLSSLNEGRHNVTVWANDTAGNYNRSIVWFRVDSKVPNVSFADPTPGSGTHLSSNFLEVNVSASDSQLDNITVSIYNITGNTSDPSLINNTTTSSSPNFVNLSLSNGVYRFNASAFDNTGNRNNTATRNTTLDTDDPSASVSVSDSSILQGESVKISCSTSDRFGISSKKVTVTDPNDNKISANCGNDFEDTDIAGSYTVKLKVTDEAGNSNSDTVGFDVASSGGGGSGGSGGDGEGGRRGQDKTGGSSHKFDNLEPDKEYTVDVDPAKGTDPEDLGVENIGFEVSDKVDRGTISVSEFRRRPEGVKSDAGRAVYRYQHVKSNGFKDKIRNAYVKFKVKRDWLEDNREVGVVRKLWRDNNSQVWKFGGHESKVTSISTGSNRNFVYSGDSQGGVHKLWDVNGSEVWSSSGFKGGVRWIDAGLREDSVYVGSGDNITHRLWDVNGSTMEDTARSFSVGNEGRFIYSEQSDQGSISKRWSVNCSLVEGVSGDSEVNISAASYSDFVYRGDSGKNLSLRKQIDGEWRDRDTRVIRKDEKFVWYEASVEGFSYLAIAIKEVKTKEKKLKEEEDLEMKKGTCPWECVSRGRGESNCPEGKVCIDNRCVVEEGKEVLEENIFVWLFILALLLALLYLWYSQRDFPSNLPE